MEKTRKARVADEGKNQFFIHDVYMSKRNFPVSSVGVVYSKATDQGPAEFFPWHTGIFLHVTSGI